MRHFLAYGNSDQVSFRSPDVRDSLDFLTVPGTIAAYYTDATAAFVLTSDLDYIIDPRTPLFQETIQEPRASHYELAHYLGIAVEGHMGDPDTRAPVQFGSGFYTPPVIQELVTSVTEFQRNYGGRAPDIQAKLARYRRLLNEALEREGAATPSPQTKGPHFVLAPYFVSRSVSDNWWQIDQRIWQICRQTQDPSTISPVVAVESSNFLEQAIGGVPAGLSDTTFFWVAGFDERRAADESLREVWTAVANSSQRQLINLYGGFYSICLNFAGLWGFNNGLGYSEARSWPELAATGAAPPRYYLPALHTYLTPRLAQLIIDADPYFACSCVICAPGGPVTAIPFHDLKRHFALARAEERNTVESNGPDDVAAMLREVFSRFEANVFARIPPRLAPDVRYLARWAEIIADMSASS